MFYTCIAVVHANTAMLQRKYNTNKLLINDTALLRNRAKRNKARDECRDTPVTRWTDSE
jgi:hypothetical protein